MTVAGLRTVETLLPLLGLVGFLLATMAMFAARCAAVGRPRTPAVEARPGSAAWKWCSEWWIWTWGPFERACVGLRIAPAVITIASAGLSLVAAALLGDGHLSLGGWTYLFGASLDLVDGRVARAQGTSSPAGAFLDSTLDRVGELAVFGGLAVHFRASPILLPVLGAAGASVLVSYARARGESLGAFAAARAGGMQRAERVVLTAVPCALVPAFDAWFGARTGAVVIGSALALLALLTAVTAARRSYAIWTALRERQARQRAAGNVAWLEHARARRRERLGP